MVCWDEKTSPERRRGGNIAVGHEASRFSFSLVWLKRRSAACGGHLGFAWIDIGLEVALGVQHRGKPAEVLRNPKDF